MIPFYPLLSGERPNRLVSAGQKDSTYDGQMARWLTANVAYPNINRFYAQGELNTRFFAGNQWTLKEDRDTFLMDNSVDARNRLAVAINILRPIVEKYRGTASQMSFNAKVRSMSLGRAETRRMQKLAEALNMGQFASMSKDIRSALSERYPIGDTEDETMSLAQRSYSDRFVATLSHLMDVIASNPYGSMSKGALQAAFDMATYGLAAEIPVSSGSHKVWERIDPSTFIWDTSATQYDLSDAEFMGRVSLTSPSIIYERYQPGRDVEQMIEAVTRDSYNLFGGYSVLGIRTPRMAVIQMHYRDISYCKMGYVMGPDNLPELVKIDYVPPGSKKGTKPRYTSDDTIPPPDTEEVRKVFGDQKVRSATVEVVRYCDMIPWEYLWGMAGKPPEVRDQVPSDRRGDIVLDHGVHQLQEVNPMDSSSVLLPIKASCWAMNEGNVLAPITDVIMPQRFFNRVMSVTEQQMNNSGSKGVVMDVSTLTVPGFGVKEAQTATKQGNAVIVNTMGMGAPNAIGTYDTTPGNGTQNYFGVMQQLIGMIRLISATPEPVTGTQTKDQLVGTTELLIERAGILDEPFYAAIGRLRQQQYQHICSAMRLYYLQRPDVLKDMLNAEEYEVLMSSADASLERLQAVVDRAPSRESQRNQVDQSATLMLQLGALDMQSYTKVWGTGSMEDLIATMSEYQQLLAQAQQQQQREQAKAAMAQTLAGRDAQLAEEANLAYEGGLQATLEASKNANKIEQISARGQQTREIDDNKTMNEMLSEPITVL